jgi:recombinational DNA repair protein RecR
MKEQLATFRNQLEEFARKHKVCSSILFVTFVFFCTSPFSIDRERRGEIMCIMEERNKNAAITKKER